MYNLKHYINEFSDQVTVVRYNELNVEDLINYEKILLSPDHGGKKMEANGRSGIRFESCDAFESYTYEGEEK